MLCKPICLFPKGNLSLVSALEGKIRSYAKTYVRTHDELWSDFLKAHWQAEWVQTSPDDVLTDSHYILCSIRCCRKSGVRYPRCAVLQARAVPSS